MHPYRIYRAHGRESLSPRASMDMESDPERDLDRSGACGPRMRKLVELVPRARNWSTGSNLELKEKLIRRNVALWIIVALILIRSSPTVASARFNVLTFGAVGDGKSDDTKAFANAWTAACAVESAVLLAPAGHSFKITQTTFRGPCRPQLVFQVDGNLVPESGPEAWPKDHLIEWLVFRDLVQMTLMGSGTFDGNGHKWWDIPCKNKGFRRSTSTGSCESPAMIRFFNSKNVVVKGLRLQNSPKFHLTFFDCRGVHIEHLTIFSPKLSPNTDGIHLQMTKSVGIYDSNISNGDDCISIGPGCAHVDIRGVTCGPSHGISIGSLGEHNSQACVSNITVRHSIIKDSSNGLRIKTWQGGRGRVWDILYQNIEMQNVKNCLLVDQYYCSSKHCQNQTSAVYVSDVKYMKITGTYDVKRPPILFACSDTVACTNIKLSEVELHPHIHEKVNDPFCRNAYGTELTTTLPPIRCLKHGNPQVSANVAQCHGFN